MSKWLAPESTRYSEHSDPGVGWRQRMERSLLLWPSRYRHLRLKRELATLKSDIEESTVSVESLRKEIRLGGLSTASLVHWYASAMKRGADKDVIAGALALIRNMAVQCDDHSLQAEMTAFACEAIALSGQAVHVLTSNDSCTLDLAPALQTHLEHVGLRAAVIVSDTPMVERRVSYRAGVTVLSAREALRDYLNDRLFLPRYKGEINRKLVRLMGQDPLQNACMCGLPFGIITDANKILIEQACEPLTITGRTDPVQEKAWAETALALASELQEGLHYTMEDGQHIEITEMGKMQLEQLALNVQGVWRNSYRRNNDIKLALKVMGLERGRHYQVVDLRVELPSGVSLPDGMIQLLEAREGLSVTGRAIAKGKLTFQRFFRRYQSLSAFCANTRYIRDELWLIYGLTSFVLLPSTYKTVPNESMLSKADLIFVDSISRVNERLGRYTVSSLATFRLWRRRKKAERLRRDLLYHDNQAGNMTAFSGRSE